MAKYQQLSCAPIAAAVVVLLMSLPSISAHSKKSPPPSPPHNDEDFFLKSCNVTPYPDFCNKVFPTYTTEIKQNPFQLAMCAVRVSKITAEASVILLAQIDVEVQLLSGFNPSTKVENLLAVLRECSSSFKAAVDLKTKALREMGQLKNPSSSSSSSDCRVEMSNAQTWLSAALTNEEKCIERLGTVSVHSEIMTKTKEVIENTTNERKFTCNALALVKDFVAHH